MAKHRIAVLPGDGIGKDVLDAAMIILKELKLDADYVYGDVGWEFWKHEGDPLPKRTIEMMKTAECCLFGAITSKPKEEAAKEIDPDLADKGFVYFSPIVRIRQEFDLHTNMRPCKAYAGNPLNYREGIDLVVFRENTEGLYSGVEFHPLPEDLRNMLLDKHKKMAKFRDVPCEDIAMSCRIFTRRGCQRILKDAFEYAKRHGRKSVTVVEKPNVIRETSGMMVFEARKMAKQYPEVELWEANIDAMCMWLIKNPLDYDVLVASNMFGDIISDLCGQLVGGLGFSPSANIGDDYALFEPTHGSAPKYAGKYKVNPIAMLISTKLMLEYIKEKEMADRLEKAIARVIGEEKVRTYDMGGTNTTLEVAEEIARKL
jgi:3-isopropylmalate dehydrogenase